MSQILRCASVLFLLTTGTVFGTPSAYVDDQNREIKALSADEVSTLLAGKGAGMARAAELNGLPGPLHVLQLADALALTAKQKQDTQTLYDAMAASAKGLGAEIVRAERALDSQFATKAATAESVRAATAEIGRLQGELRAVHLRAHLDQAAVLDAAQVDNYRRLRGYGGGGHDPAMHAETEAAPAS